MINYLSNRTSIKIRISAKKTPRVSVPDQPDSIVTKVEKHGVVGVEGGVPEHVEGEGLKLVELQLQLGEVRHVQQSLEL